MSKEKTEHETAEQKAIKKVKRKWRCAFFNASHTSYAFFLTLILYFFVVLFVVPTPQLEHWNVLKALKALSYLFVFSFILIPVILLMLLMTHSGKEKIQRRPYLWEFIGICCGLAAASLFFWPGKFM